LGPVRGDDQGMREDDGRKLDHRTLEALRLRAVEQVARGVPAAEVGAGLAVLSSSPSGGGCGTTAQRTGGGPVFCVVDNHPAHRAKAVGRYVDSTHGALRLYRLRAYSPQLNPDEWVWKNVKHDGVAPAAPRGPKQMKAVVTARLRRLQRLPHIVRGFFGDPELAYITAVA
jgi:transposase